MLVGLTPGRKEFSGPEYAAYSDAVSAVVECFGPTDLPELLALGGTNGIPHGIGMADTPEQKTMLRAMSPLYYVQNGEKTPPFLLLHGDADPVVPFSQGERMYRALTECGVDAQLVRVHGAEHEGNFWSRAVLDYIGAFFDNSIGKQPL